LIIPFAAATFVIKPIKNMSTNHCDVNKECCTICQIIDYCVLYLLLFSRCTFPELLLVRLCFRGRTFKNWHLKFFLG